MCCCIPEKDWIDTLSALLTPVIAIAGVAIGIFQWRLSNAEFRYQMFDKRFAMYEAARDYIGTIVQKRFPPKESQPKFLQGTSGALFLFNDEIGKYIDEIWKKSVVLESLHLDLSEKYDGDDKAEKKLKQSELLKWYDEQLKEIEGRFSTHLSN